MLHVNLSQGFLISLIFNFFFFFLNAIDKYYMKKKKNAIKRITSISLDNKKKHTRSLKISIIYTVHLYNIQVQKHNKR